MHAQTSYQFFWRNPDVASEFRAGVSLHSHTMYSEERLELIPKYMGNVPIVRRALDKNVDYSRAFWTPPLSPRQSLRLEEKQIQRSLRLPALVSLSDHDDIRAGAQLRVLEKYRDVPVSTEWTVPFGRTIFHIGVHNIPAGSAREVMQNLQGFTANPKPERFAELIGELSSDPEILLVVNHPLWDEEQIGSRQHEEELASMLQMHGAHLHAVELNGLRSWTENRRVLALGERWNLPVVAGGDRHGREPNAVLNVTRGRTLPEFIEEVRRERRSHIVFMPQYRQSLTTRTIQTVVDVLRRYPEAFAGRRNWTERVFYRHEPGTEAVSLASIWPRERMPTIFHAVTIAAEIAQTWGVRMALRHAFKHTVEEVAG